MDDLDRDESTWLFVAIPLGLLLVFATYSFFGQGLPPRTSPLSNEVVFGCYEAPGSPNIRLDSSGMQVLQGGFPLLSFRLQFNKSGYALTAEAPVKVDLVGSKYHFGLENRGIGTFLPFYRTEGGQTYGVFDPSLLSGFRMLANDGNWLNYRQVSDAQCALS